MRIELQNDICAAFPLLYRYRGDQTSRFPFAQYGMQCGDGWHEIIRSASAELAVVADSVRHLGVELVIFQVKEKFHELIIYTHLEGAGAPATEAPELTAARNSIRKILRVAHELSQKTCMRCAGPAVSKPKTWRQVAVCASCLAGVPWSPTA